MGRIARLTGRPGWYVEWTDGAGRRRRRRARGTREQARQLLRDLEHKADRERLDVEASGPAQEMTLRELVEAWRAYVLARRRPLTWESYAVGLRAVLGYLGERGNPLSRAADLRLEEVTEFAAWKLEQGAATRTVNLRVGAVRALLNWAVGQGHLLRSPLARWRPLRGEPRRRRGTLGEFEIAQLLLSSPPELADVWRFVLGTGLRAGELTNLEWGDIDWTERLLRVRAETSKSRRERLIPLRDDLLAVLRRQRERKAGRKAAAARRVEVCELRLKEAGAPAEGERAEKRLADARRAVETAERLVFTNTGGGYWRRDLARRLKPCLAAANLASGIDLHTLRHTFASHLAAGGVDLATVSELLGHSSLSVTSIYLHTFDERKRSAVEVVPIPGCGESAKSARRTRASGEGG